MNIKEFSYYVEEHLREFLPEDRRESAVISVHPKGKVNDTLQYGLTVRFGSEQISPVLYLEDAWQEHEKGADLEAILGNLAEEYMEYVECQKDISVDVSMEYESVKDRVVYQVLNKEANRNNLRERIYSDIGQGLVKVYAIYQTLDSYGGEGNIAITHNVMKHYGYDMKEILEAAEENTPRIYPAVFTPLEQVLSETEAEELANKEANRVGLNILSNSAGYRGAGALFYPGMQKKIAGHFGKNYYVLPSSLHEVLILPEGAGKTAEELEQMVRSINRESVSKEDFLSNKVLFYDREKEQLRTALPDIPDLQTEDRKKGVER